MDYGEHDRDANRELLRELASVLGSEPWVESVSVFPATQPESIVVSLLNQHYPEEYVDDAYVEVQSYRNGDFHSTYVESGHGDEWLCRWDRHDSEAYGRDHFHAPPSARHEDGTSREYPQSLFDMMSQVVVPWIFDRMGELWDKVES